MLWEQENHELERGTAMGIVAALGPTSRAAVQPSLGAAAGRGADPGADPGAARHQPGASMTGGLTARYGGHAFASPSGAHGMRVDLDNSIEYWQKNLLGSPSLPLFDDDLVRCAAVWRLRHQALASQSLA